MSVYLCISIDCECDKGPGWRLQKPLAFSGIAQGIGQRLQPLFRRYRMKPTYLLSPEIMHDPQSVETLARLAGEAELGTHLHGELAGPGAFEPDVTSVFQRDYDRETERQKLQALTELFRDAFGRAPRSFRAGRFGIGANSLELLQELGYRVDSSVTPHKDWTRAGAPGLSFRRAPTQPYWPVLNAPERRAEKPGPLMEVPVTIRPSALGLVPLIGHMAEPRWLRPTRGSVERLIAVARDELRQIREEDKNRPVLLNCMFHNVEVVPGASPYAQTETQVDAIMTRLAGLLAWAEREDIRGIGLAEVPELFEPVH